MPSTVPPSFSGAAISTLRSTYSDTGATTIAAIYKERWQVELFFRQQLAR